MMKARAPERLRRSEQRVITMDYAQNLTLSNVADTPSSWYSTSLTGVSVLGVSLANVKLPCNFLYSQRKGGNSDNDVISMMKYALELQGAVDFSPGDSQDQMEPKRVVVWADSCGGQNTNSFFL